MNHRTQNGLNDYPFFSEVVHNYNFKCVREKLILYMYVVSGVLVNVSVPEEKHRFVVVADFFGVSNLTMADFKLPILNWHTKFLKI